MKYLVIGTSKGMPLPPDQTINLYQSATDWVDHQIKAGKVDCMYIFPEGGGMAIGNVDSQEEAFDILTSYPLYSFFEWQVKVLVDWKHGFKSIIERSKMFLAK